MLVTLRKPQSIPGLELMGLLLGIRLTASLKEALNNPAVVYWTDSQVMLYWVRSQSEKFKQFVSAIVQEVHNLDPEVEVRIGYVPTELNPPDALTKGQIRAETLSEWLEGPKFLLKPSKEWPEDLDTNWEEIQKRVQGEEKPKRVRRVQAGPAAQAGALARRPCFSQPQDGMT